MSALDAIEAVFTLRRRYWANGYRPLEVWGPDQLINDKGEPLKNPGKQPRGLWRASAAEDPPEAARIRPDARALSTGLLCGEIIGMDVDIPARALADGVVHLIETKLGTTPLARIGNAPKILLVYRPERPFCKLQTSELFLPDGTKLKVEILAEGQQFVAAGVHPETGQPYTWTDGSPETVMIDKLPVVTEEQARAVIVEAERLLRTAGAKEKEKPKQKPNGSGGGFFGQINTAALANIEIWARALFPRARLHAGTGAWRVSSEDLGRDLQEDISIHPGGIWDFGEEVSLTAVDLVMRYGDVEKAIDAALWLCGNLGIAPETLGYMGGHPRQQSPSQGISLNDFHAYMPMHSYVYEPTREMWPVASVNARIPPVAVVDASGHPAPDRNGKQIIVPANLWLDQNKPVEQMTWIPGLPMLIRNRLVSDGGWIPRNGVTCFNLYRPPIIAQGDPVCAVPWLSHVHKVFPDDADQIVQWLAHRVQRPQEKINHALVLGGEQGIGKDTLLEPVKPAIGPWNFAEVSPRHVLGRFNGFLKSVVLRVNEARDLGDVDRFAFYDHMKAYIAARRSAR
jgi:Bifunctional DNA primase/polymerase, N-terminal